MSYEWLHMGGGVSILPSSMNKNVNLPPAHEDSCLMTTNAITGLLKQLQIFDNTSKRAPAVPEPVVPKKPTTFTPPQPRNGTMHKTTDFTALYGLPHPWSICSGRSVPSTLEEDIMAFGQFLIPLDSEIAERKQAMSLIEEILPAGATVSDLVAELKVTLPVNDLAFYVEGINDSQREPLLSAVEKVSEQFGKKIEVLINNPAGNCTATLLKPAVTQPICYVVRVLRSILIQCGVSEGSGGWTAPAIVKMCLELPEAAVVNETPGQLSNLLLAFLNRYKDAQADMHITDPASGGSLGSCLLHHKVLQSTQTLRYCLTSLGKWDPSKPRSALSCVIAYRLLWARLPLVEKFLEGQL
eukprot:TRINITY_DN3721_c0_g6_i1.p1 TRINITY_DN3721_c0_g6~~TRINITY_DN3721_c0_g6_i1.p1  ORF type:complete len:373 (+),score=78.69 TRINITY_DN3721_c0_g6_i1:55-1119(+)